MNFPHLSHPFAGAETEAVVKIFGPPSYSVRKLHGNRAPHARGHAACGAALPGGQQCRRCASARSPGTLASGSQAVEHTLRDAAQQNGAPNAVAGGGECAECRGGASAARCMVFVFSMILPNYSDEQGKLLEKSSRRSVSRAAAAVAAVEAHAAKMSDDRRARSTATGLRPRAGAAPARSRLTPRGGTGGTAAACYSFGLPRRRQ